MSEQAKPEEHAPDGLNPQQVLFCEEYLIDLNATQAALRAGYSPDSAYSQGHRLLKKDEVRTRIYAEMDKRSARTLVHADYVVSSLVDVANRCQQAVPVMEYDPVEGVMRQKGSDYGEPVYEFDSQGANKALELLGKHLGIFLDKKQNGDQVTKVIVQYESGSNTPPSA